MALTIILVKSSDNINNANSSFWLYDASYAKLKNLQLGYTVPRELLQRLGAKGISVINVYVSGENLLTITKYPGWDVETEAQSETASYPTMKQYALGVNITF